MEAVIYGETPNANIENDVKLPPLSKLSSSRNFVSRAICSYYFVLVKFEHLSFYNYLNNTLY